MLSHPIQVSLIGPVIEELLYRGLLQPALCSIIQFAIPATATVVFGSGAFTVAAIVSIVATSIIFGIMHLSNPHANTRVQATFATIGGIVKGALTVQFGLGAAIAAHIINNTMAQFLSYWENRATATPPHPPIPTQPIRV